MNTTKSEIQGVSPETVRLIRTALDKGASVEDVLARLRDDDEVVHVDKTPPKPLQLSEHVLKALKTLPDVFGKVSPKTDRKLTKDEIVSLVYERDLIDAVLSPLKHRKDESIREALANHADAVLDEQQKKSASTDRKGHYAVRQEFSVEGIGRKVLRFPSGGKPVLTTQDVEQALEDGVIDRATYLKITSKPESPRVLDTAKLIEAGKKDPALLAILAHRAGRTPITTTVRVVDDK